MRAPAATFATLSITLAFILACGSSSDPATGSTTASDLANGPLTAPGGAPVADARGQLLAYQGRFAADPVLTPEQVALIPPADLKLVRNEIYARYGRPFNSPDIKAHFEGQAWYKADAGYTDARLSPNDKANLDLITSFEADAKDLLSVGQFNADAAQVMFVDPSTATVDVTFGMYEDTKTTLHWASRGDWVVLWEGPPSWDPRSADVRNAQLWKVKGQDLTLVGYLETPAR